MSVMSMSRSMDRRASRHATAHALGTAAVGLAFTIVSTADAELLDDNGAALFWTADDNPEIAASFSQTGPADGNVQWNAEGAGSAALTTLVFTAETISVLPGDVSPGTNVSGAIDLAGSGEFFTRGAFGSGLLDGSFEFFLRPSDLTGDETIFETGGDGNGLGLGLRGDQLVLGTEDDEGGVTGGGLVSTTLTAGDISDFIQVVGVHDGANDQLRLYLNGALVGSQDVNLDAVLSGGNDATLGFGTALNGAIAANVPQGAFDGQIAAFRFYNTALTDEEVLDSFNAFIPEPASAMLMGLGLAAVFARRR